MVVVLTGDDSLDFTSEIGLNDLPYFSLSASGHINPKLIEEVDSPRSHSTGNHHICLLRMDILRDHSWFMVRKIRIFNHLKPQYPVSFHIDKSIEGTSTKVGAEYSFEARTIFGSQCNSFHFFTSCFWKWYRNFSVSIFFLFLFQPNVFLATVGYLFESLCSL